jgi:hypothetical protein
MTINQMMFITMFFVSMNNFAILTETSQPKGFVFDNGMYTRIKGNGILRYIRLTRDQDNPSYVFKHTRVMECTKDKKLTEVGTLGSLEKIYRGSSRKLSNSDALAARPKLHKFVKFARMNNAVYCYNIEQKINYFDNLEDVGAIIYGTQNVEDCDLVQEYLKQQKLDIEVVQQMKTTENK